ncbi:MAG: hypothetical protein ACWA41_09810 [Putridiphycobacter sp.]
MTNAESTDQFYFELQKRVGNNCKDLIEFIPITNYQQIKDTGKFKIYEDWWLANPEVVVSKVKAITGQSQRIFARKTVVKKINKTVADQFLNDNHIYGTTQAKHKLGLFSDKKLVAVATFTAQRNLDVGRSVELIRFCSLNGTTIVGGLDKLLKYYIKTYQPNHIMTYIDKDWGNGKGFLNLGFKITAQRSANTYVINPHTGVRTPLVSDNQNGAVTVQNSGSLKLEKQIN